ncbi:MAG: cobalt ECF transporter T component CbiQ, partial [Bacillota bacterium]|nr:cobalt ECF transporter T component CbiQ [Bacillota bacterium]
MSKVSDSLYSLRLFDDLSRKKTFIHDIHPLSKLLTTVVYLIIVVSFGKYEISRLVPFIIYPILLFSLGDIPIRPVLNRVLFVFPFIFFIGIFSPILDKQMVVFYGISFSKGWFAFLSIMFKCLLTVTAALLLIATTGMDKLS